MKVKFTRRTEGEFIGRLRNRLSRLGLRNSSTVEEIQGRRCLAITGEEGATLVEMALVTSMLLMLVIGIMNLCLALYSYNYICNAAREATRYTAVRGSNSCINSNTSPKMPNCNLLPTNITSSTNNPVLTYIEGLGFPGINNANLTVLPTWWVASSAGGAGVASHFTWSTQCTAAVDASNIPCNNPRNGVKVVVTYNYPLNIPFWQNGSIPMSATSWMVIVD